MSAKGYLKAVAEDVTLKEHDKKYHPNGFDPKTMTCEFRERRAKLDPVDGDVAEGGIRGIFTGSSAIYNRPSLLKVGTGEGSQVYGWGLYGSTVRGVAEEYAFSDSTKKGGHRSLLLDGKEVDWNWWDKNVKEDDESSRKSIANILSQNPQNSAKVVDDLEKLLEHGWISKEAVDWYKKNKDRVSFSGNTGSVYSQTFFTNRAPGDESHLLNWYEPVSEENKKLFHTAVKEGLAKKDSYGLYQSSSSNDYLTNDNNRVIRGVKDIHNGQDLYFALKIMLGSAKAASEWFAKHDIDGIKYPVDSYGGKGVKDGDKVGWNYVSFRDDNIRVDRRFVDGKEQEVKDCANGKARKYLDLVAAEDATLEWTGGTNPEAARKYSRRRPIDRVPKKDVKTIISENCKLIKTIDEDMLPLVAGKVYGMLTGKVAPDEFVEWCMDEFNLEEWQSYRIARDQIVKAQEGIKLADWKRRGINFVMWCHSGKDNEPRDYHVTKWDGKSGVLDGKPNGLQGYVFRIDDPPVIDKNTNQRGWPATMIGCKCFLRAVKGA